MMSLIFQNFTIFGIKHFHHVLAELDGLAIGLTQSIIALRNLIHLFTE